jgi:nicotinamidase/pyrazinamidase
VLRKGEGGEDGYWGFRYRDPVTGEQAATLLEELLRRHGVQRVVVRLGFDTVVVGGLVRTVDLQPGDGERALTAMRAAGARIEQPA